MSRTTYRKGVSLSLLLAVWNLGTFIRVKEQVKVDVTGVSYTSGVCDRGVLAPMHTFGAYIHTSVGVHFTHST